MFSRAPTLPGALTHLPMASELTQPWPFSSSSGDCQSSWSLSFWQQQDKLSPVLLLCIFAVCLQEKKPSPCSFCLLNWGKEQRPRPKARTFIGSVAVVQAYCGRAQILSPPHRVTWEYHYNSARFRQQYFLSVLALENLLLLDTHQVVNGKFGSRCGKIYKHILAIFLLLPGSWDLITDLEKGLHFPLTRAQSPGLLVLSSRLISHSCVPRNRHRECNKSTPKISLLARNILRRVICLELGAEHILAAVSSPSSCHLRLLY